MQDQKAYEAFTQTVSTELRSFLHAMDFSSLVAAADLIDNAMQRGNRVHISGIGKPAHIAGYIASVMSSTGTPAYFLHGTEAVHGSCGQLVPGDVVIFMSNSGETQEMRATVSAVKNGLPVIAICTCWQTFHTKAVRLTALPGFPFWRKRLFCRR